MSKKSHKNSNTFDSVKGTIEITRSGMGYVITEDGEGDIMIRPADFNRAFHGDKVRVQVKRAAFRDKKREGVVLEVISRKQTDFIGTLRGHAGRWFFLPDSEKPLPHFELDEDPPFEVDEEGKVIVRFVSWDKSQRRPKGKFIEQVKQEDLNDMAMKNILLEKGFPLSFSDEAEKTIGLHALLMSQ